MQLLGSLSDVQPGQQVQVPVKAVQGFNYVRVVAANAEGNGWPVQVRAFAGHDLPVMDQVKMTWSDEDEGSVTLTYSVKPTGENGGYIDPASLKYTIYQHFDQYPMYRPVATDITDTETVNIDCTARNFTDDRAFFFPEFKHISRTQDKYPVRSHSEFLGNLFLILGS